jgi:hypothetical protein
MSRATGAIALFLTLACTPASPPPPAFTPPPPVVPLFQALGPHHHAISTKSQLAQRYFDQGLVLTFGFNHAEAIRSFQEAARQDPACAMCWWGVAQALGPNINLPMAPEDNPAALAAVKEAQRLAQGASSAERLYIEAVAKRYSAAPDADRAALDRAYSDAMREVARQLPEDLDAATLFAESLMDLSPWDYWTRSGEPKANTGELVATLERVLAANPDHPGAIHLYIHAVEASKDPDRAVPYADRLTRLVPDAGHLVHMPTHIYQRVGRYHDAAEWNARAAEADEAYLAWCRNGGFYPVAYYPHNVHFLWSAATMEGRSALAIESARKVVSRVTPEIYARFPPLEAFEPTPLLALARFGRWNEILAEPAPAADLRFSTGMWHYARGLALANTGRLAEAEAARRSLASLAADETLAPQNLGGGTAGELLSIAEAVLAAEIAGRRGVREQQVQLLEAAVKLQDGLPYYEPPGWDYPIRQALGAALLDAGRPADAERVYREDLREFRENGWSLFGLARALELQGKRSEAADARKRFEAAWQHADVKLKRSRF